MSSGKQQDDDRMDVDEQVNGSSLPWVEKYRPETLEEIVAQENIVTSISNLIRGNKLPHLLLYGPPGTGKTSAALSIARQLNGKYSSSMTLELNASDERGIAVVRDKIKTFASTQQIFQKGCKFIILDEGDSMTSSAQFTLRRVIEKYTKNTRFCIICNYVNKIIPALQSRCTKFRFSPLKTELIRAKLEEIAVKESVRFTAKGIGAILHLSHGDMRKCLNIMQSTNMSYDVVDESSVYQCTGNPSPGHIRSILDTLLNSTYAQAFNQIRDIQTLHGYALVDMISEIQRFVTHLPDLPDNSVRFLLSKLAQIEYDLAQESSEEIQTGAFVGIFQIARAQAFA